MGGFFCSRKEQKVRPYYDFKYNIETGELSISQFGERFREPLVGVLYKDQQIRTRIHEWKIEKIRLNEDETLGVL